MTSENTTESAHTHERTSNRPESAEDYHDVVFLVERRIYGRPKNVEASRAELETRLRAMWSIPEAKEGDKKIVEVLHDRTIDRLLSRLSGLLIDPGAQRIIDDLKEHNFLADQAVETPPSRQTSEPRMAKEILNCGCCGYGLDPNGFEIRVHNHDNCGHLDCAENEVKPEPIHHDEYFERRASSRERGLEGETE